jgi:protein tyrosine phosphatase
MVVKEKVKCIAMLTGLIENEEVKCQKYFPDLGHIMKFENIKITCKSEETFPTFVKKTLEVKEQVW